jgi:hypothetical protein
MVWRLAAPHHRAAQELQQQRDGMGGIEMSTIRRNENPPGSRIGYLSIEAPSATFLTLEHRHHAFRIEHPANWSAQESADGRSVTIAPEGGLLDMGGRERDLIYGLSVHAGALPGRADEATTALLGRLVRARPMLKPVPGHPLVLAGPSTVTGEEERVTVVARQLPSQQLLLAALIAPSEDYGELEATFDRMIGSLKQL